MTKIAEKRCVTCSQPTDGHRLCGVHRALDRQRKRRKGGFRPWRKGKRGRPPVEAQHDLR